MSVKDETRTDSLFTTVLTYDAGEGEDEEGSLTHIGGFGSKLPPGILPHGLPQVKEVQPAVTAVEQEQAKQEVKEGKGAKVNMQLYIKKCLSLVRELSEEEKQMIIFSEDFQRFVDRAGRIVERALAEGVDIYADYTGGNVEDGLSVFLLLAIFPCIILAFTYRDEKSYQRISLSRYFYDERWSKNRCVTSLDWSQQYPELLLASYTQNEDSPNDPDGVVLIWNTKYKKSTPEYIFHCQSSVMSSTFVKFHPNLILGGTYSGQIVLWDNRVQKRTPIQRTPLSTSAHTVIIFSIRRVKGSISPKFRDVFLLLDQISLLESCQLFDVR